MIRELTIETTPGDQVEGAWTEIASAPIATVTSAEFGFAEETIALLAYTDGSFEVGIGESLRPYVRLYAGRNERYAEHRFWAALTERAVLTG